MIYFHFYRLKIRQRNLSKALGAIEGDLESKQNLLFQSKAREADLLKNLREKNEDHDNIRRTSFSLKISLFSLEEERLFFLKVPQSYQKELANFAKKQNASKVLWENFVNREGNLIAENERLGFENLDLQSNAENLKMKLFNLENDGLRKDAEISAANNLLRKAREAGAGGSFKEPNGATMQADIIEKLVNMQHENEE